LDNEVKENLINASIDGMEIERKKLASVLHDNISALLSSVGLQLSAHIAISPTPPSEEIIKARAILKEAHDKVRDLSHELIPPVLAKLGLYYAVQDLCEKNSTPIIQFSHTLKIDQNNRYDEDFEIKVYYILAELVNNIIKHSQASKAHIMLIESNGLLEINIQDNGKGFDDQKNYNSDGFGLTQIKARVKNLNGTITINSKFNIGSFIAIKVKVLPLSS
jgi:two-component system NarL family sensor kinase